MTDHPEAGRSDRKGVGVEGNLRAVVDDDGLEVAEGLGVHAPEGAAEHPGPTHPAASGRRVLVGTVPAFDYQGTGAKVDSLVPKSPAERAGIQPGDVIVRMDDQAIRDLRGYSEAIRKLKPNQRVTVQLLRDGKKVRVKVTVVAR